MATEITSVAVTNSTVDGTSIGLTTRAQGKFTDVDASTVEVSGLLTVSGNETVSGTSTHNGFTALNGAASVAAPAQSDSSTSVPSTAWVRGLFTGSSLGSNGYIALPGGLVLQWGSLSMGGGGDNHVSFPIAFPSACLQVICSTLDSRTGGSGDRIVYVVQGSVNTTGCTLSNNGSGSNASWFAIGH